MTTLTEYLRWAADIALWDLLSFGLTVLAALWALCYFSRRRYDRFSLYPTFRIGTDHSLYPNVIYFAARNIGDSPIVVCRPNFRPSGNLTMSDTAHGNLDTGDYELKFRYLDTKGRIVLGKSFTTILLHHRESALAYIPIGQTYSSESFETLVGKKTLGWITFDIVTVGEGKPKVIRMKQKVKRLAKEVREIELGDDPGPRNDPADPSPGVIQPLSEGPGRGSLPDV